MFSVFSVFNQSYTDWLLTLIESLPFGMGVTRANFKQSGKMPVRNNKLII